MNLTCVAVGIPPPNVQLYFKGGANIASGRSIAHRTIIVNPDSAGEYYCIASAMIIRPEGGARSVTRLRSIFIEEGE